MSALPSRLLRPAPAAPLAGAIAEAIRATNHLRRGSSEPAVAGAWKEWFHFCVLAPEVAVLVNLSVFEDPRPAARGAEVGRALVLVHAGGWHGGAETFAAEALRLRAGALSFALGPHTVDFRDGRFRVMGVLARADVSFELDLTPLAFPTATRNAAFAHGSPVHWLAVPRLAATGTVTVGRRSHTFDGVPAYHDHNWGRFRWGGDFAWEWGVGLPDDPGSPWSLVFDRLTDRSRGRVLTQGLYLWRGAEPARILRERAVRFELSRQHLRARPFRIPAALAVLAEGEAADVPATLSLAGLAGDDRVEAEFAIESLAQVLVPNDADDLRLTTINETVARMHLRGRVDGEALDVPGRAFVELVRG
ncbi:MAG: hypothetical protein IPK07_27385 [Deltaproteobacteria bacterium]|nr:hypothetical protein [Deltaproteobacteria bacterium]